MKRGEKMNFKFTPELVKTNMEVKNQEEAIYSLAEVLIHEGYVSEEYPKLVLEREKEYPTGLVAKGAVIAMPHAFDSSIKGTHTAIGILKEPVTFHNMEDMDETIQVKIMFMLAIGAAHAQLEMLQILMQMVRDEQLFKKLSEMTSAEEICEMLNEFISTLDLDS